MTCVYSIKYDKSGQCVASRIGGGGLDRLIDPVIDPERKLNEMKGGVGEGWQPQCFCRREKEPEKPGELPPCSENEYKVYFNTELRFLYEYKEKLHDEPETYFYHPDHLGSSSWITNQDGDAIQHLQYLPFGEQYVDQRTTGWNAMFTFSGKERDEETGYGYFGARYYDSDISIWLSVDPLAYALLHQSPYVYCSNNPIGRVDPNGMFDIETGTVEKGDNLSEITKQINEKYGTNLSINDIAKGNGIKDINKIQVGDKIALPGQNAELNFDLKELKVTDATYGIDMPGLSWEGTSGRDGYQSPGFQSVKDKGPIPEGSYTVDPAQTQNWKDISSFQKTIAQFGRGTWRGGTNSWGTVRTWLIPMEGTNTLGRNNFSIHGGKTPGSAGCIDLTKNNNNFHYWFKSYGKPIKLNVKY